MRFSTPKFCNLEGITGFPLNLNASCFSGMLFGVLQHIHMGVLPHTHTHTQNKPKNRSKPHLNPFNSYTKLSQHIQIHRNCSRCMSGCEFLFIFQHCGVFYSLLFPMKFSSSLIFHWHTMQEATKMQSNETWTMWVQCSENNNYYLYRVMEKDSERDRAFARHRREVEWVKSPMAT